MIIDTTKVLRARTYVCNLFHVVDHFIVAFGLLAEPREEGFTRKIIRDDWYRRRRDRNTFRATGDRNVSMIPYQFDGRRGGDRN